MEEGSDDMRFYQEIYETTGGKSNRVFGYKKYLDVLKSDVERG